MTTTRHLFDAHHARQGAVRFWEYVNGGWVKLTLAPGQTLRHASGGPTDEGYHVDRVVYQRALDGSVTCWWATEARDCDGRLDQGGAATLDRIEPAEAEPDMERPAGYRAIWASGASWQRDHAAEAMGY